MDFACCLLSAARRARVWSSPWDRLADKRESLFTADEGNVQGDATQALRWDRAFPGSGPMSRAPS